MLATQHIANQQIITTPRVAATNRNTKFCPENRLAQITRHAVVLIVLAIIGSLTGIYVVHQSTLIDDSIASIVVARIDCTKHTCHHIAIVQSDSSQMACGVLKLPRTPLTIKIVGIIGHACDSGDVAGCPPVAVVAADIEL